MLSQFKNIIHSNSNTDTTKPSHQIQSNESTQKINSALETNPEPQKDQEKEVPEETQKLTNYLQQISSLNRTFKAQCFSYSNKLEEHLSEKMFSFDIAPITKEMLQKLSNNKSNISNISKQKLYDLAANGEFSSLVNILNEEDKLAVLSQLDCATEHPISQYDIQILQQMLEKYPLYTVLHGLQDQKIFDKLKAELDSTMQYIHGYNQDRYLRTYSPNKNNNFSKTSPHNDALALSGNANEQNPDNGIIVCEDGVTIESVS